jgi:hypothetical protein
MLHYFKFRQELFAPAAAKDVYVKRGPGKGWPEECPPIRAANAFGFDLLANFDLSFVRGRNGWRVEDDVVVESDFDWAATRARRASRSCSSTRGFGRRGRRCRT